MPTIPQIIEKPEKPSIFEISLDSVTPGKSTTSSESDRENDFSMALPRRSRHEDILSEDGSPEIKVKRKVVKLYRNRHGKCETATHEDHPERPLKTLNKHEVPSMTIYREFDEKGDLWRRSMEVEWWAFAEFLDKSEKFSLNTEWGQSSIVFADPFVELFLRRDALRELCSSVDKETFNQSRDAKYNIAITEKILQFLDNDASEIGQKFEAMSSATRQTAIQFMDLWMLYRPGTLVFDLSGDKEPACFMIDSISFEKPRLKSDHRSSTLSSTLPDLTLYCWVMDYDGNMFGRRAETLDLGYFPGSCQICNLSYVPERFLEDVEKTKGVLKARGKSFWALQGPSFRQVANDSHVSQGRDESVRVMVDQKTHASLFGGWSISGDKNTGAERGNIYDDASLNTSVDYSSNVAVAGSTRWDHPQESGSKLSLEWFSEYNVVNTKAEPTELALLLCPRTVHAFSFRDKSWGKYDVSKLKPVEFRENAWSRLVLNDEYKDVIRAMVKSYLTGKTKFQDLVAGKGSGLVILMHGPPGVGKTLTAECAAEAFQKPLYMLTAGDLGTDPETLEKKLSSIFDYAVTWNAILLLDEADIFLQDRDYDNLQRNALVSIFLRTLEYFNGIMFLTSNRVGAFDQAFQSRIHITIGMPEFDEIRRKEVWKIFIQDLGRKRSDGSASILTKDECRDLGSEVVRSWAAQPLNGRQIRNCVRSSMALAEDKGVKPNASHFNTVIKLGNAFTQYMKDLRKAEENEIAQIKGDRLSGMKEVLMDAKSTQKQSAAID